MSNVMNVIEKNGYKYLMNPREFVNIKPKYADRLVEFVENLLSLEQSKIGIVSDIDIDGILSAKIVYDTLKYKFSANVDVIRITQAVHGITNSLVQTILKGKYTHIIIVDSSTNEISLLNRLCNSGIKTCVIDHHVGNYSLDEYHKDCIILSNKVCEGAEKLPYKNASCGLLCALYCNYLLSTVSKTAGKELWVYATITLYSDCVDLLDQFNVMIINYTRKNCKLTTELMYVSGKKTGKITREIISFSINPKLNACLRLEKFELIHRLFFENPSIKEIAEIARIVKDTNSELKEYISDLEQKLPVWEKYGLSILDLTGVPESVFTNLKGLLANKIANNSGKLAIGFFITDGMVKGSVRDPLNRDCLSIFRDYCVADGHPSAFGFSVEEYHFYNMLSYVSECLKDLECERLKPIIIEHSDGICQEELNIMGEFNEYATINSLLFRVKIDADVFTINSNKYGYSIKSNKISIVSCIPVTYGLTVLVQPVLSDKLILKVKTISA